MVKDWAPLQDEIRKLYHVENKPLSEVMRLIKGKHLFHASERSYRTQLQKWGYMKYNTESHPKPTSGAQRARQARPSNLAPANPSASARPAIISDRSFSSTPRSSELTPSSIQPNVSSFPLYDHNASAFPYGTGTTPMDSLNNQYLDFNQTMPNATLTAPVQCTFGQNEQDSDGKTQLHRATISGSLEQVKTLLFAGVAVNIKDQSGNEALHYAAIAHSLEKVQILLRFGADVNARGQLGRSPLHLAVPDKAVAEAILQHGADLSLQDSRGETALHLALSPSSDNSKFSRDGLIDTLVRSGSDVNVANNAGITPFHKLVDQQLKPPNSYGICELLVLFLNSGASITCTTPDGKSPFQVFLTRSRRVWERTDLVNTSECVPFELFLAKGADPLTKLPTGEPVAVSLLKKDLFGYFVNEILFELLCNKVDLGPASENGNSCLHALCANCRIPPRKRLVSVNVERLMRILLERGADPNLRNRNGQSPFMLLFTEKANNRLIVLRAMATLLAHDADPMLPDSSGNLPLYKAAERLSAEELKPMLRAIAHREQAEPQGSEIDADTWWYDWHRALEVEEWTEAKNLTCTNRGSPLDDINKKIRASSFAVLAEKHLDKTEIMFQGDSCVMEKRRKRVAAILRDCRAQAVEIDFAYFDYLLELCQ